ncbi:hypothetical protein D3C84_1176560 [compost metagenome]
MPAGVSPIASIVVMSAWAAALTGNTQERTATPFICTVHAPHKAMPQPNFVPVMPSTSRNAHSNGVSSSTSVVCTVPFIFNV